MGRSGPGPFWFQPGVADRIVSGCVTERSFVMIDARLGVSVRGRIKPSWSRGAPLSQRELERAPTVYGELTIGWWIWDPAVHRLVARVTEPAPQGSA